MTPNTAYKGLANTGKSGPQIKEALQLVVHASVSLAGLLPGLFVCMRAILHGMGLLFHSVVITSLQRFRTCPCVMSALVRVPASGIEPRYHKASFGISHNDVSTSMRCSGS